MQTNPYRKGGIKVDKNKIERINYLAAKSKECGLTEEEKIEQKELRDEYRAGFRRSLTEQLSNTYIVDKNGNKTKIKMKEK